MPLLRMPPYSPALYYRDRRPEILRSFKLINLRAQFVTLIERVPEIFRPHFPQHEGRPPVPQIYLYLLKKLLFAPGE